MFINILFNNRGERTQGECVVRANGPDTQIYDHTQRGINVATVYVKIVLYSSVTPLSEGKMVMNE